MGVNITFDASKVTYVSNTKSGLFDIELIKNGADCLNYVGVSASPVDLSSTRLATVTFRIDATGGTVTFGCQAIVDDQNVACSPVTVIIVSEP